MLENNRLYRRIQTNNLFKTFSRTYARQTAKLADQKGSILESNISTQHFDRTNIRSCLDQRRADSQVSFSERDKIKGSTAPAFVRTEQANDHENSHLSQTMNITLNNTHSSSNSYSGNPYLNSLIVKRK